MTSWLPTFTTWQIGVLAAALAAAALLALYFLKLRRREMEVSSTLLWKKAVQDLQVNAPFQRLRRNLLLLLQLAVLLMLCLALARPVINTRQGAGKLTVVLIDRSASMGARDVDGGRRTRLDEAKRLAREVVDSMKRDDNACVIAFDATAQTVCPLTSDTAQLRSAIDAVEQTDRPSRLKLAYQLAEAQASFIPEQNRANVRPDVFLFSDGRALDSSSLTLRANVVFEKIGKADTKNIAIAALSAKRNYERPGQIQVFARLANYGPQPVEADVNLSIATQFAPAPAFQVARSARTLLYPERWDARQRETHARSTGKPPRDSVDFTLELSTGAVIKLEQMNREGDALAADDVAHLVVPPPKTQSVLLVSDGNYYLDRLRGTMQNVKTFDALSSAAYEQSKPLQYDVIIFDRYAPKWLPQAGNFMYFGAAPPGGRIKLVLDGPRPVYLHQNTVLDWQRDHPMLRGINLGRIYVEDVLKLDVPSGVERLVEGSKGPLILFSREGRSNQLVIAFDLMQSDWPLKLSFPVFMYNALQFLALGSQMDVREAIGPGETVTIPLADLRRIAGNRQEVQLYGPTSSQRVSIKIPAEGDFVLPPLDRVGLYWMEPAPPGYERFAVNMVDGNESNLVPADQPPGGIGQTTVASGKKRTELWWWLALAAVPLLLIEWWVYTRRVHL